MSIWYWCALPSFQCGPSRLQLHRWRRKQSAVRGSEICRLSPSIGSRGRAHPSNSLTRPVADQDEQFRRIASSPQFAAYKPDPGSVTSVDLRELYRISVKVFPFCFTPFCGQWLHDASLAALTRSVSAFPFMRAGVRQSVKEFLRLFARIRVACESRCSEITGSITLSSRRGPAAQNERERWWMFLQ